MTPEALRKLAAAAMAAPSVHNVQPARWLIEGDTVTLLEDPERRLAVGDPSGNDAAISLGAAAEGLRLAASREGLGIEEERLGGTHGSYRRVARYGFSEGIEPDPLAAWLEQRASWRGPLLAPGDKDRRLAAGLAWEDVSVATEPELIERIARRYDRASFGFIRKPDFRRELLSWMRLSQIHKRWSYDGLNASALKLSRFEALAAGAVLGWLFRPLTSLGLAPLLLAEQASFRNAAGIAVFHRPQGEDPFESGKRFHRLWLAIEATGMGANVLAALADDPEAAAMLKCELGIPHDRRIVSAFRIGRRAGEGFARARLPLDEVLVG